MKLSEISFVFNCFFLAENFRPIGYFKCNGTNAYIAISNVCDDRIDCKWKDDEIFCDKNISCPKWCRCNPSYHMICSFGIENGGYDYDEIFGNILVKFLNISNSKIGFEKKKEKGKNYDLVILKMNKNLIRKSSEISGYFPNLFKFQCIQCNISRLDILFKEKMRFLYQVSLSDNPIRMVSSRFMDQVPNLKMLDLSLSRLEEIEFFTLLNENNLIEVNLSEIKSSMLKIFERTNMEKLEKIHLKKTRLDKKNLTKFFKKLKNLKEIFTEYFFICCLSKKFSKFIENCQPNKSKFNSCKDMIENEFLNSILLFFGFFSFFLNFI